MLCTPTSNWFTYRMSYYLLMTLPSWIKQHEKHGVGWILGTQLPVCYDNAPSPSLSPPPCLSPSPSLRPSSKPKPGLIGLPALQQFQHHGSPSV